MLGTAFLFCANSFFDSTNRGLEKAFVRSLTGDFAIGARTEENYGFFGSEIPIVSEYETIPAISDFTALSNLLNGDKDIAVWTPLVSASAMVSIDGYSVKAPLFGIDAQTYFKVNSDIELVRGNLERVANGGILLNEAFASAAEKRLGRKLDLGESIVLSMYVNGSFRIRKGELAGIYRYPAPTDILDRVVLADPVIVRALCDYTQGFVSKGAPKAPEKTQTNMDDLFGSASDTVVKAEDQIRIENIESQLADTGARGELTRSDFAAWSFVSVRTGEGLKTEPVRLRLEDELKAQKLETRTLSWKTAAGNGAMIVFAIGLAFNVGIGFIILGAALILMNALVNSVLERTGEIGSIRALGASRNFVRGLFIVETMTLTMSAAFLGILLGCGFLAFINSQNLEISNPLIATLFGSTTLKAPIMLHVILNHFLGAAFIGALAWLYPVSIALRVQPVSAMRQSN